jgi:type I restriction enzyme, S subunit
MFGGFPEKREQENISSVLLLADEAISTAEKKARAAREVKLSLMQQLFSYGVPGLHSRFKGTKIGEIPDAWDVILLGALTSVVSGIALNPDREPRLHPHRYLTVINVQREKLELSETRYMEVFPSEIPDALLEENDIVLVEGHANSSEIGRAALITEAVSGYAFQNHLFRLRRLPDCEVVPLFLLGVLNSERVRRHWNATCNTSSGLNTINRRGVRRLLVQRPDPEEQKEIAKILEAANVNIARCDDELASINELKGALLQSLMSGKVRVRG